jgi:hypothetical protein
MVVNFARVLSCLVLISASGVSAADSDGGIGRADPYSPQFGYDAASKAPHHGVPHGARSPELEKRSNRMLGEDDVGGISGTTTDSGESGTADVFKHH